MSLLTQASLIVTPNAVKEGKLYSVIPTNGNGDMTVVRATGATRTNELGFIEPAPYNLLGYSEMFSDVSWAKGQSTITINTINAPNGTLTADTLTANGAAVLHNLGQNFSFIINTSYTFSVYLKANTNNFAQLTFPGGGFTLQSFVNFDLINGVLGTKGTDAVASIVNIGNGWYRCSVTATCNNSITQAPTVVIITSSTSIRNEANTLSTSVFLWGAQLVQGSVPKDYFYTTDRLNVPRLNYDSVGGCPSILVEPQRTNLLLNSVLAGGGTTPTSWLAGFQTGTSTPVTSIKNPNVTAYRFTTSTTRQEFSQTFAIALNSVNCFSVYVESITTAIIVSQMLRIGPVGAGAGTTVFLKNNVVISSATNIEAGFTYSIVLTCTAADSFQFRVGSGVLSNTTGNFVLSMPQLELSSYSTSFIPTTIQAITRNSDAIYKIGIADLIGQTEGTFFIDFQNKVNEITTGVAVRMLYSITDGTVNNRFSHSIIRTPTRNYTDITIRSNNVTVSNINVDTITGRFKIAVSYKIGATKMFINGVLVGNVGLSEIPIINRLFLGCSTTTGGENANVGINTFLTVKTALTDSECIALTTL